MKMKSEPVRPGKGPGKAGPHAGPQGTQVFSRDEIADILDEATASGKQQRQASLVLLTSHPDGRKAGEAFALTADRLTIGRSAVCDFCIEEPSMSSEHARLVYSDNAWRIINLLSTNGVFVNDEKVFSHRLHDGDEIRLGRTRLRFSDPLGDGSSHARSPAMSWLSWTSWVLLAVAAVALVFWGLK